MVRILKWLAGAALAFVLFSTAVYLVSRAMGPTRAEREALARVDAPVAYGRHDGFSALWSLGYDVPPGEQAAVLAEDVRRATALPPAGMPGSGTFAPWRSAREDWPRLGGSGAGDPGWCRAREAGCLDRVGAGPGKVAALPEPNAPALERVEALTSFDHFRSPFPPREEIPFPEYQQLVRPATHAAWRFSQGDVDAGLSGACSGISRGRTLVAAGDSLIGSMMGAALIQGNTTLLAEMLAELPRDRALPAPCAEAFAAVVPLQEGVCRTMLSEGRFMAATFRSQLTGTMASEAAKRKFPGWTLRLLFDPERAAARTAPTFAWYCGDEAGGLLAQDRPLHDPTPPPSRWSLACASNYIGCILSDIARPAYGDYGRRLQDADARLRTMAALLWLRTQEGPIDAVALERLPATMRSPARPLQLDATTGTLATAVYGKPTVDDSGAGAWSVPLPASRLQSAGASP